MCVCTWSCACVRGRVRGGVRLVCACAGWQFRVHVPNMDRTFLRGRYGCTRVQLGVQHTDDAVLAKINRGCYTRHTMLALARRTQSLELQP